MGRAADKHHVNELRNDFLVGTDEALDRMQRSLGELVSTPEDAQLIAEIFRTLHSIKGATGFLAFPRLEALAHAGEDLLSQVRERKLAVSNVIVDGLLDLVDRFRVVMDLIETTGGEGTRVEDDDAEITAILKELSEGGNGDQAREIAAVKRLLQTASNITRPVPVVAEQRGERAAEKTVRVDVEVLKRLMEQVSELVLTRNQMVQSIDAKRRAQPEGRRLDAVITSLRATVTQARTQPVGQLFQKFRRLVRGLSRGCGRPVDVRFAGQDIRLDKTILEALIDPITHALRNAVDHGIESREERMKCGKRPQGLLTLSAYQDRREVVIEVSDDGRGIAVERVLERAVERGLISAAHSQAMTLRQALNLVFEHGLTTCDEVTLLSGRGVGLDIVRSNVESVGGVVEIETRAGQGTTLRMRVPMTLVKLPELTARWEGHQGEARSTISELMLLPGAKEAARVARAHR